MRPLVGPREGASQASQTLIRRVIVERYPSSICRRIPSRWYWKAYSFAEWLSLRLQDLAMEVEDLETRKQCAGDEDAHSR